MNDLTELNEGAALDWDFEIGDVVQTEVYNFLQLGLSKMLSNRCFVKDISVLIEGACSVFRKGIVKHRNGSLKLLDLLNPVASADNCQVEVLGRSSQSVDHRLLNCLAWKSQSSVDVEKE